jgi:hypothetical protein
VRTLPPPPASASCPRPCMPSSPQDFCNKATHSMCGVCGNISTACSSRRRLRRRQRVGAQPRSGPAFETRRGGHLTLTCLRLVRVGKEGNSRQGTGGHVSCLRWGQHSGVAAGGCCCSGALLQLLRGARRGAGDTRVTLRVTRCSSSDTVHRGSLSCFFC